MPLARARARLGLGAGRPKISPKSPKNRPKKTFFEFFLVKKSWNWTHFRPPRPLFGHFSAQIHPVSGPKWPQNTPKTPQNRPFWPVLGPFGGLLGPVLASGEALGCRGRPGPGGKCAPASCAPCLVPGASKRRRLRSEKRLFRQKNALTRQNGL